VRALIILVLAAGCAADGTPLRQWTVDAAGSSPAVVTLPGKIRALVGGGEIDFTLTTHVPLAESDQGRAYSLVVDCFHGPLALRVNGHEVEGAGTVGGGSWQFIIEAADTRTPELELQLAGHSHALSSNGFGTPPRFVAGIIGDPRSRRVAAFNRYSSIVALLLLAVLGIPYIAIFLLDRRRAEYAAILMYGLSVTNVPLIYLDVYEDLFGSSGIHVSNLLALINYTALLYSIHLVFDLGPVHRRWLQLFAVFAGLTLGAMVLPPLARVVLLLHGPLTIVVNGYSYWRMVQLARGTGEHRFDARLTLFVSTYNAVCILQGIAWILSGVSPLGGVHPLSSGIALTSVIQAIVLARQHVARQRTITQTNAELQRQVAERSRELAEALAQLAKEPGPMTVDRVIDDRYRVIGKLGAGGMGTVHEVERIEDGKRFALKMLRGIRDPEMMTRFAREAQLAAELRHPNLVPVFDVGITDGGLFLVMPLVTGGTLADKRDRFGDPPWAMFMLQQIASGLAALHAKSIVHRDLKPANILLEEGVLVRITDLGIASLATAPRDPAVDDTVTGKLGHAPLTHAGDVFGTPTYMAPELADGVHAAKPASDIFAFGLIAYEMITGNKPFVEPPLVMRMRGADIPVPDITGIPPIIARCLDLDPAQRPTAAELVTACTVSP
jgi:hypothetical protein